MSNGIFYKKADLVLDKENNKPSDSYIKKLLQEHFHEEPISAEENMMPTLHYVYHIILKNKEYFLKVSKFNELKYTLYLESNIYTHILNKLNIGLKVLATDINCQKFPFPYSLLSKARGLCLKDIDIDSSFFDDVIKNVGKSVARCHMVIPQSSGYGLIDGEYLFKHSKLKGNCKSWDNYIWLNLRSHLNFAVDMRAIDMSEKNFIESIFEEYKKSIVDNRTPYLLHGDLGSHNIFVNESTHDISAIIDWEDALLGDPAYDIAMFTSFYRMHEFLNSFLEGYKSVKKIEDENFFLRFWIYYIRIVIAKSVLRFRFRYDEIGESASTPKIKIAIKNIKKYL